MERQFRFTESPAGSALVIVFPPGVKGLFNTQIHDLVQEVRNNLDGVYVTYALSSGGAPTLRDALAAARFGGCESAVVVSVDDSDLDRFADGRSIGDWMLSAHAVSKIDAPAVIDAYVAAVAEAGRAA